MEHDAIIEALPREALDALDMLRRKIRPGARSPPCAFQLDHEGVLGIEFGLGLRESQRRHEGAAAARNDRRSMD